MIFLALFLIAFFVILLSKSAFNKWINHISIYVFSWFFMLFLYEMKLMNYIELSGITWAAVSGAFLSFLAGSLIVTYARRIYKKDDVFIRSDINNIKIFKDGGIVVKYSILVISILGILGAIQLWMILIRMYGSIPAVFLNANDIYRLRVEGEIKGVIPYISSISYVGVFLSGIYVAYKRKITIISILPFVAVNLREIANFARAGILSGFFLFLATFILFRHLDSRRESDINVKSKLKVGFAIIVVVALVIGGAGLVRSTRGTIESFRASSQNLNQLRGGFFITPSLYLYASSHVGVLSRYFEKDFDERNMFGEITFQPVYNFLSKFGVVKHPSFYDKGYFIPMWTNTSTYLRPLYGDFGVSGIFLFPFLLGFGASFFWYQFFEKKKLWLLVVLSFFYVIIMFSFLTLYTRSGVFIISFFIVLILIPILERLSSWNFARK
ncbi:MAG TPA: O-antigen polymerase [Ignavibacteriaceae bacterium]|nr:O-antigen polymerase [Ignavibacteriaceae bacterium]